MSRVLKPKQNSAKLTTKWFNRVKIRALIKMYTLVGLQHMAISHMFGSGWGFKTQSESSILLSSVSWTLKSKLRWFMNISVCLWYWLRIFSASSFIQGLQCSNTVQIQNLLKQLSFANLVFRVYLKMLFNLDTSFWLKPLEMCLNLKRAVELKSLRLSLRSLLGLI